MTKLVGIQLTVSQVSHLQIYHHHQAILFRHVAHLHMCSFGINHTQFYGWENIADSAKISLSLGHLMIFTRQELSVFTLQCIQSMDPFQARNTAHPGSVTIILGEREREREREREN